MIQNIISAIITGIILGSIGGFFYFKMKERKKERNIPEKLLNRIKLSKEKEYLRQIIEEKSEKPVKNKVEKVVENKKVSRKKLKKK